MSQETTRLRRLIEDEVGECCEGDVDDRLGELQSLTEAMPAGYERDLTALQALGNDTRHQVVRLVAAADELCVCEITPLVDVSESAVSHALSDLTDAGLLSRRKEGTWRYYSTTARADALLDALDDSRGEGA